MNKQYRKEIVYDALSLLFICIIAYLPLSSFFFSLKNDAYIYNFPNKFFFSESLHNGILPVWNPYLNYGFPLFADPGFAWWHPFTWLFGIIGYNAYTFTLEVLLYIYIAGVGMYWLGRKINVTRGTTLAMGGMYMCCGFFVGNLQHINFLTAAAFLPWLVGSWLLYQNTPTFKHLIYCGVSIYLICASGHPAVPIAISYFMLAATIIYYLLNKKNIPLARFVLYQIKLAIVACVLLLPLLCSYFSILPYYSRIQPTVQADFLNLGFTLPSYISFFIPFATIKNPSWFSTDVSMRNAYFSLIGAVCFISFLLNKNKQNIQKLFLFTGILFLILSLGGSVKKLLYELLPAFEFIRTNGEFRVLSIFSFIICSAFEIDKLMIGNVQKIKFFEKTFILYALSALLATVFLSVVLYNKNEFVLQNFHELNLNYLKYIIDTISFKQTLLISFICAFIISSSYIILLKKRNNNKGLLIMILIDLVLNCWLLLPITGVNKTTAKRMQSIFDKSPEGFPIPSQTIRRNTPKITAEEKELIGNWQWYNKEIKLSGKIGYPSILKSTEHFFTSADTLLIKNRPFIFAKNQGVNTIQIVHYTPTSFQVKLNLKHSDTLVILQNYFWGWQAKINDKNVHILKYAETFMAIIADEESHTLQLHYCPL